MLPNGKGTQKGMILVFGLPRSGTSWLGKIFDSHPDTLYRHEPDKQLQTADVPLVFPVDHLDERRDRLEAFLRRVLSNRSPDVTGKLPAFSKSYRSSARHLVRTGISYLAKALPAQVADRVRVPDLISPGHPGPRLVWKSISSLGRVGALARLLPDPRILLLLRHPCGQIASTLRGHAAGNFQVPPPSEHYRIFQMLVDTEQGRAHGLTLEDLRSMHPVERLAWRWVLFVEKAIADTLGLANCRLLRYEDLCAAPMEGVRELFGFTGLGWHLQTESFIQDSTKEESDQYFGIRKDPGRSASKWRQELEETDIRRIFRVVERSAAGRLYLEESEARAHLPAIQVPWRAGKQATVPAEGFSLPS